MCNLRSGYLPILLALLVSSTASGQELKYKWQADKTYAYSFNITATVENEKWELSGHRTYTADPFKAPRVEEEGVSGSGTGFVISDDGYLMTCHHVVEGAREIKVHLDKQVYTAKIVAMDKPHDLALLKIEARGLPVLPLAKAGTVQLAQDVRAFGFPFSDVLGASIKITAGTVAGFVEKENSRLIHVDAAINPGNSGGPVVNDRGEVVGVASAKLTGRNVSNVGFVVPIEEVLALLGRNRVGFEEEAQPMELNGPELANKVVPAVAYITVSGITKDTGERFRLAFEGKITTKTGKQENTEDLDDGSMVASVHGQVFDMGGTAQLPFFLGSLDMLLVETFSPDQKQWVVEDNSPVAEFRDAEPVRRPGGNQRLPLFVDAPSQSGAKVKVMHAAVAQTEYSVLGERSGMIEIKKTYRMATVPKFGRVYAAAMGEGTLLFDPDVGVPSQMDYSGKVVMQLNNRPTEIPVTVSYRRVDPGAAIASSADNPTLPRFLGRPDSERLPVPAAEELDEARELIAEVYEAELNGARTPPVKIALAEKLLATALDTTEEASGRYALFEQARTIAIEARDLALAQKITDELAWAFRVNGWKEKYDTLNSFIAGAKTMKEYEAAAAGASKLMEIAIGLDEYAIARAFGGIALTNARKSGNDRLSSDLVERGGEMATLEAAHKKVQPALQTLATNATDPAANLEAGKYYCYWKNRWSKGLAMLALCDDATLRPLAELELADTGDARDQMDVADGWWDIAEAIPAGDTIARQNVRRHAAQWYRKAAPESSALAQAKANKRIAETDATAVVSTSSGRPAKPPAELTDTDKLIASVKASLEAKKGSRTKTVGFALGNETFAIVPEQGGIMVGFNLSGDGKGISAISPLFLTEKGPLTGPAVGKLRGRQTRVVAKEGYAVGGVWVAGGLGIGGMAVEFMKITPTGLDPQDSYRSNWYGNAAASPGTKLGFDGSPVIGVWGNYDANAVKAIGLAMGEVE